MKFLLAFSVIFITTVQTCKITMTCSDCVDLNCAFFEYRNGSECLEKGIKPQRSSLMRVEDLADCEFVTTKDDYHESSLRHELSNDLEKPKSRISSTFRVSRVQHHHERFLANRVISENAELTTFRPSESHSRFKSRFPTNSPLTPSTNTTSETTTPTLQLTLSPTPTQTSTLTSPLSTVRPSTPKPIFLKTEPPVLKSPERPTTSENELLEASESINFSSMQSTERIQPLPPQTIHTQPPSPKPATVTANFRVATPASQERSNARLGVEGRSPAEFFATSTQSFKNARAFALKRYKRKIIRADCKKNVQIENFMRLQRGKKPIANAVFKRRVRRCTRMLL